tara:strand:- start:36 stop:248 length:213 start_codon:yes stop_codon:yes gene_type:complete
LHGHDPGQQQVSGMGTDEGAAQRPALCVDDCFDQPVGAALARSLLAKIAVKLFQADQLSSESILQPGCIP